MIYEKVSVSKPVRCISKPPIYEDCHMDLTENTGQSNVYKDLHQSVRSEAVVE